MATLGKQSTFPLAYGVHREPSDAPATVLRQVASEAQALRLMRRAGGHKQASLAAHVGKSVSYVSRLLSGERPIPEKLVRPLCVACRSNLLSQFRTLQAAIAADEQAREARLAEEIRSAA